MTEPSALAATRIERDALGEATLPAEALYGIHTWRAVRNFPIAGRPVHPELIHAYGAVKLACATALHELGRWDPRVFDAIAAACREMIAGELDAHILADALQGGAGTSTNMNVNEVLANRALQRLGHAPGCYDILDPLDDLNACQSTNDTYSSALKVASIRGLRDLQESLVRLQEAFQRKEKELADVVKIGRTEMQDAVLTTLGRSMGAYAEAFSRDRWRVGKCEERLRVVNLGGTAIGTGLGAPRAYIFRVTDRLREITGLGLARAENLVEATQNQDAFAEVSGILKACAVNLLKTAGDLRLLSSGPAAGLSEIALPALQAGSSIMPGKVNPVIPEAVTQAAIMVIGYDVALTQACAAGSLELNAFLPLIADSLLQSIDLLRRAADTLARLCVDGLTANAAVCRRHVENSTAILTALAGRIGYKRAGEVAAEANRTARTVRQVVMDRGLLSQEEFDQLVSPEAVMRLGSD